MTTVEQVTGAPEVLGGRVKTLHPRIHAGVLARLELEEDRATLAEQGIEPFELVCVNLYPFSAAAARADATPAQVIEMIDVGGPSLLRAAAKNYAHVAVVSDSSQYEDVLGQLRDGGVSLETRRSLASAAFALTAAYDAAIAAWFAAAEPFPDRLALAFTKVSRLAYGENPHQAAAYYAENGARVHLLGNVEQLGGRELSYNNLADLEAARRLADEFAAPAAVIIKHGNPSGVAVAESVALAYERALAADPLSAFGCVLIVNRPVDDAFGARIAEHFVEVVMAPAFSSGALEALRAKPALRILQGASVGGGGERDFRRVLGGLLVQERDGEVDGRESMEVVVGSVTELLWDELLFAWSVCKHASSNAIVLSKGRQTLGIGAGQTSRVDAVQIALDKAARFGHDLSGAVLASDAFFPFADGPQLALDAGVIALIQPGGSVRDELVLAALEGSGAAMVFTGRRHFRH